MADIVDHTADRRNRMSFGSAATSSATLLGDAFRRAMPSIRSAFARKRTQVHDSNATRNDNRGVAGNARLAAIFAMVTASAAAACVDTREGFSVDAAVAIMDSLSIAGSDTLPFTGRHGCVHAHDTGTDVPQAGILRYVTRYLNRDNIGFECAWRQVSHSTERSGTITIDDATELVAWRTGNDTARGTVLVGLFYEHERRDTTVDELWPLAVGLEGIRSFLSSADTLPDIIVTVSNMSTWGAHEPSSFHPSHPLSTDDSYYTQVAMTAGRGPVPPTMIASQPSWVLGVSPNRISHEESSPFGATDQTPSGPAANSATFGSSLTTISPSSSQFRLLANEANPDYRGTNPMFLQESGERFSQFVSLPPVGQRPTTGVGRSPGDNVYWVLGILLPLLFVIAAYRATVSRLANRLKRTQQGSKQLPTYYNRIDSEKLNFSKSYRYVHRWARIEETRQQVTKLLDAAAETAMTANIRQLSKAIRSTEIPSHIDNLANALERLKRCVTVPLWRMRGWRLLVLSRLAPKQPYLIAMATVDRVENAAGSVSAMDKHLKAVRDSLPRLEQTVGGATVAIEFDNLQTATNALLQSLATVVDDDLPGKAARLSRRVESSIATLTTKLRQSSEDNVSKEIEKLRERHKELAGLKGRVPSQAADEARSVTTAMRALREAIGVADANAKHLLVWRKSWADLHRLGGGIEGLNVAHARSPQDAMSARELVNTHVKHLARACNCIKVDDLRRVGNEIEEIKALAAANQKEDARLRNLPGKVEEATETITDAQRAIENEIQAFCGAAFLRSHVEPLKRAIDRRTEELLKGFNGRIRDLARRLGVANPEVARPLIAGGCAVLLCFIIAVLATWVPGSGYMWARVTSIAISIVVLFGISWLIAVGRDGRQSSGIRLGTSQECLRGGALLWFVAGAGVVFYTGLVTFGLSDMGQDLEGLVEREMIARLVFYFSVMLGACSMLYGAGSVLARDGTGDGNRDGKCESCGREELLWVGEVAAADWKVCEECELCTNGMCSECGERVALGRLGDKRAEVTEEKAPVWVYCLIAAYFGVAAHGLWRLWSGVLSDTSAPVELEVLAVVAATVVAMPLVPAVVIACGMRGPRSRASAKRTIVTGLAFVVGIGGCGCEEDRKPGGGADMALDVEIQIDEKDAMDSSAVCLGCDWVAVGDYPPRGGKSDGEERWELVREERDWR